MDFGRGLRYPLQDPNWGSKVLIGTLISFVPILNFAATGYVADVTRNIVAGRETPLPEWDRLGENFVRGFLTVVIQFLWALPLLLLLCPLFLVAGIGGMFDPSQEPSGALIAFSFCLWGVYIIGALILAPLSLVGQVRFFVTNNFSEALPGPVLRQIRGNWRPWLMVLLFALAIGLVFGVLAACTFGLGALLLIPFVFYIQLIAAHWYAQAYRESSGSYSLPPSMV